MTLTMTRRIAAWDGGFLRGPVGSFFLGARPGSDIAGTPGRGDRREAMLRCWASLRAVAVPASVTPPDRAIIPWVDVQAPRKVGAPSSISSPGSNLGSGSADSGIATPAALPSASIPVYGALDFPSVADDEGPEDGLSLDEAINLLIRDNLTLKGLAYEIPQAEADIITGRSAQQPGLLCRQPACALWQLHQATSGRPDAI